MKKLIKHKGKYYIQSDTGYSEVLATTDRLVTGQIDCKYCK